MTTQVNGGATKGDGKSERKRRGDNKEFHFVFVKFEVPVRTQRRCQGGQLLDLELKRELLAANT